jgi:hypothetical protein
MRRRFAPALNWYATLCDATHAYIQDLLERVRANSKVARPPLPPAPTASVTNLQEPRPIGTGIDESQQPGTSTLFRPTEYLRHRCPLCFGGVHLTGTDNR